MSDCLGSMMEQEKKETVNAGAAGAGSEALNSMMGASQWEQTDKFSESPLLTQRLEPSVSSVDVAGYN